MTDKTIIDFHVHLQPHCTIPFDLKTFHKTILMAKQQGVNTLCIAEHLHTNNVMSNLTNLFIQYSHRIAVESILIDDIDLFLGLEITTREQFHLLVIAPFPTLLELYSKINTELGIPKHEVPTYDTYLNTGCLPATTILELISTTNAIVILSNLHSMSADLLWLIQQEPILSRLDAIELNAHELHYYPNEQYLLQKLSKASKVRNTPIPIVTGSDTLYYPTVGVIKTIFEQRHHTIESLKQAILQQHYIKEISPLLDTIIPDTIDFLNYKYPHTTS